MAEVGALGYSRTDYLRLLRFFAYRLQEKPIHLSHFEMERVVPNAL